MHISQVTLSTLFFLGFNFATKTKCLYVFLPVGCFLFVGRFIVSVVWACTVSSSDFILYVLISLMHHRYDMEAIYFDEGVRNSKQQFLESKVLDVWLLSLSLYFNRGFSYVFSFLDNFAP